jgi:uncharacterized membrane protein
MEWMLTGALWLHLASLGLGGAATFGIPILGMVAGNAPAEGRPTVGQAVERLSRAGRFAMGVLIFTGLFMIWGSYGLAGLSGWFWVKMVLVAAMIVLMVISARNGARARAGDTAAQARQPLLGGIGIGLLLAIILTAVLTFL